MTCGQCKHWIILPSIGSAQQDRDMIKLGYRNCDADTGQLRAARYLHKDAIACRKFRKETPQDRSGTKSGKQ